MAVDTAFLAVDLGAESGRAVLGRFDGERMALEEVHRFPNTPVQLPDGLHWDVLRIVGEVKEGLAKAASNTGRIESLGVDAWGVDFALLDRDGSLISNPYHYRDPRTEGMEERALDRVPKEEIYETTGIQFMPINTLYQLLAMEGSPLLGAAQTLLLIPDLIGYWLTGEKACEYTNATTTQLCDARSRPRLWRDHPARYAAGDTAARSRRGDGSQEGVPGHSGRLPRHRLRSGRGPRGGGKLRLHLQRHLVAGGHGTARSCHSAGGYASQLYQRGRLRGHDAFPEERHGTLATAGVQADLGPRRAGLLLRRADPPRRGGASRRRPAGPGSSRLSPHGGYARAHPSFLSGDGAEPARGAGDGRAVRTGESGAQVPVGT